MEPNVACFENLSSRLLSKIRNLGYPRAGIEISTMFGRITYTKSCESSQAIKFLRGRDKVSEGKSKGGGQRGSRDGVIKAGYKCITDNKDDAKAVVMAMLDRSKSLADVGRVAWDKTKEKTKRTLEEKSDELVKVVINYAFGDRSLVGYTPGDAYLLIIKTKMQVIDVWDQKYDMAKKNELYAMYNTNLHSRGRPSLRPGTPGGSEEPHPLRGYPGVRGSMSRRAIALAKRTCGKHLDESHDLAHDGRNPGGFGHTFYLRTTGRIYTSR
jgi:hypothetical protein